MRSRWTRQTAVALLSAAVVACGESTAPLPQDLTDVLLDFCASETPVFFGIQNDGGQWERVVPDAQGTFSFQAAERFTLAIVHQDGTNFSSEYIFAAPSDLQPLNGVSCIEREGAKVLNGTVANVPAGSAAMITMANSFTYPVAPTTSWQLTSLPTGTLDLIAHRELVGATTVTPDRVIIRRAQDLVNNATAAVLDFSSNEAQNTATHSFSASGLSTADETVFQLTFSTPTTRRHSLSTPVSFTSGAQTLHGIPAGLTQAGDFHELEVFADRGTSYRGEVHYYRSPVTRSVGLGAVLTNPTLTTVSSSPLRLRTQLPSQFEYGSFISVAHVQSGREVFLTVTNSYYGGTPITWDVTIPDLTGVAGFPTNARLQSGAGTDWFVDAYGGNAGAAPFLGAPTDGAILHYAGRSFFSAASQQSQQARTPDRRSPITRRRGSQTP